MTFVAGKVSIFKLQDAGGTLRDLSAFFDKASCKRAADMLETTCFGLNSKTYVAGLLDGSIPLEGYYDSTATTGPDVILAGILGGVARTFELGPEGGTTGKVRYTGQCLLKEYDIDSAVAEIVSISAELQLTGDVTKNTFP
jgi:hypothetical protein